ncbi:MAG: tRNA pseudouridine(55) synthase TruB [Myxococcales bacterium]|nr:tRNA pseudouridine(55) synthase TruB [Myxococcales bacterium]
MARADRAAGPEPRGVLLIDKPSGLTSFGVVARVRRALGIKRVGHTGTLDPLATGLLPICVGAATRLVPFLTDAGKTYRATVRLGVATDTYDADGQIVQRDPLEAVAAITADQVEATLAQFRGVIDQRPPAFSAIQVDGERLYARARRGEAVEAPVRTVTVHRLEMLSFASPDLIIEVDCSKGTYIRSLAVDLGAALGLGAHLSALRRLRVGAFDVDDALSLDALTADVAKAALVTPAAALAHLPAVQPDEAVVTDVRVGRRPPLPNVPPGLSRLLDATGRLVAIIDARGAEPLEIVRGFPPDDP